MPGDIIVFEHANFRGHHRHIFDAEPNLNDGEDSTLNDAVSSFVILEGTWEFFRHANFNTRYAPRGGPLGPGRYPWVGDLDIENDQMSSLRCI